MQLDLKLALSQVPGHLLDPQRLLAPRRGRSLVLEHLLGRLLV
jgi:hypothetical protein